MHITSNSKSLLNEEVPNERKDEEIRFSLQCKRFNDYSPWSIVLNITECIFADGLI